MKKILVLIPLFVILSSFAVLINSSAPNQGYTGADGLYCTNCHSTNVLNSGGGSITAAGLPSGTYSAGTVYNFSIQIAHGTTNRRRFGFSIEARNSAGQKVGTFSSTNPNAAINGDELSHLNAPSFVTNQLNYTYTGLRWTAPANPSPADATVTFYYVGVAGNGSGSSGDFVHAGTQTVSLLAVQSYTFTGNGNWSNPANWSNGQVPPSVITGSNTRIFIDPATNGECVLDVPQQVSSGATIEIKEGKAFRVNGNLVIAN